MSASRRHADCPWLRLRGRAPDHPGTVHAAGRPSRVRRGGDRRSTTDVWHPRRVRRDVRAHRRRACIGLRDRRPDHGSPARGKCGRARSGRSHPHLEPGRDLGAATVGAGRGVRPGRRPRSSGRRPGRWARPRRSDRSRLGAVRRADHGCRHRDRDQPRPEPRDRGHRARLRGWCHRADGHHRHLGSSRGSRTRWRRAPRTTPERARRGDARDCGARRHRTRLLGRRRDRERPARWLGRGSPRRRTATRHPTGARQAANRSERPRRHPMAGTRSPPRRATAVSRPRSEQLCR